MSERAKSRGRSLRRRRHVRRNLKASPSRPRLSVFRSNKSMSAQIIDDLQGSTLAAASTYEKDLGGSGTKTDQAGVVGTALAKRAIDAGITRVVFDRGSYAYAGRVRALAEAARKGGLEF